MKITANQIAKMIDHSILNPIFTQKDTVEGCELAKKYDVASVCVKPCFVNAAYQVLKGTDVKVSTVIGFPHGSNLTEIKVYESKLALEQGCTELDMVMNIGAFLGGDYELVKKDIKAVCDIAHKEGAIVKVILENAYLNEQQIAQASKLSEEAGADFVKTSTGYAPTGATIKDLKIMRSSVSPKVSVKAAGGIRTLDAALKVRAVGTDRFGCTATVKVMEEALALEKEGKLVLPTGEIEEF